MRLSTTWTCVENNILRRVSRPKGNENGGWWRSCHSEELCYLYKLANYNNSNKLLALWNPELQCCSPIIPIQSRMNSIPRMDTYFFKIHSNIVLPSTPRTPTFFHSGYMTCPSQSSRLIHSNYIRWTVQIMKFLIVKPSLLPILIPLGPKYSPLNPGFIYPLACVAPLT